MSTSVDTIYLIHHSHTDLGYTHDQPIVWDLQRRFIDAALDLVERDADRDDDAAFRWTVETTSVLLHWLRSSTDSQVARFVRLARAGRIEVTAMLANITPLYDLDQLIESFQPLRTIRDELGLPVRSAMNSDVNGQNWPLVDVLLDLGIEGFSMAINTHFGGALWPDPCAFHWEGPSGRSLLAWNGWSYGLARRLGIGRDAAQFAREGWPAVRRWLAERSYPLPVLMLQIFDAFGDNGPADPLLPAFVRAWNARGMEPRLRIALPHEWWEIVASSASALPRWRGDWTDFWNFGCGSSAREQAINRASRARLFAADAAVAVARTLDPRAGTEIQRPRYEGRRDQAVHAISFWDEHTWGADCSIREPANEDTLTQWIHKASYAHTARSLTLLLARDGVAELSRQVARRPGDQLLIFNPLAWERTVAGPVPDPTAPRGRPADPTAARHFQDRRLRRTTRVLKPTSLPAFGYVVVSADAFDDTPATVTNETTIETGRYRLSYEGVGITSLYDRFLERELVDQNAGLPFFGFVHETVADRSAPFPRDLIWRLPASPLPPTRGWQPGWPAERQGATEVLDHRVERDPTGVRITRRLLAPGVENLVQTLFLPSFADWIECTAAWDLTTQTHPEATYVAFPFRLEEPRAWFDVGGQACEVERDQLPGACRDYLTVQRWVELANADWGITVATPDAPMVQLGGFHFGDNRDHFTVERALLLGWVTNNYWSTNFRAHQPGRVSATYRILPHRGPFRESTAHRFGADAALQPLVQHLGEPPVPEPSLPAGGGTLLQLPEAPVEILRVKPGRDDRVLLVRLVNASSEPAEAVFRSGLLTIDGAARCDLLERPGERLPVVDGTLRLRLPGRALVTVELALVR